MRRTVKRLEKEGEMPNWRLRCKRRRTEGAATFLLGKKTRKKRTKGCSLCRETRSISQTDKEETVRTNGKTRVSFFEEERQEEKPCFFIELVCPKTHFVQSIKSNSFLPPVF